MQRKEKGKDMIHKRWKKVLMYLLAANITGMLIYMPSIRVKADEPSNQEPMKIIFKEPVSQGTLLPNRTGGFGTTAADDRWQQLTLPIGNSYMGANIYGEIGKEHVTFNQKSLWNGGPSKNRLNYNGGNKAMVGKETIADYVKKVQAAFLNGDPKAQEMCNNIIGEHDGYGAYQGWGDIYMDFDRAQEANAVETVDDRDPRIQYDASGWSNYGNAGWYGNTEKYNDHIGSFSFVFEGTGIQMIGATMFNGGDYDVYIDDMAKPYHSGTMHQDSGSSTNQVIANIQGLSNGKHTIKFQSKTHIDGSVKTSLDYFKITKEKNEIIDLNPNNSATTHVLYNGQWMMYDRSSESDHDAWVHSDEMYVDKNNAFVSIQYTFNGTGIQLMGAKSPALGRFTYQIDDGKAIEVNTNNSTYARQEILNVTGLSNGNHTIKIESKGDKLSFDNFVISKDKQSSPQHSATTNYERSLDLDTSLAKVIYNRDDTQYTREYIASYPDNVIAIKLTASGTKKLDFDVSFPINNATSTNLQKTVTYTVGQDMIRVAGHMNDNQLKLFGALKVTSKDGTISAAGHDKLTIKDAREAVIFVTANTDYKDDYPTYRTGESDNALAERVIKTITNTAAKGYDKVKNTAIKDYQNIYHRVQLNLGQQIPNRSINELLAAYNNKEATSSEKRYLEVMMFQYGRYLQIASSRAGDLPANLQGVWNNRVGDENRVPWASDYHMNVNLQMNYWPTYVTNMAECGKPLIEYVNNLREPGRITASTYFGIDNTNDKHNGFTANTQNTPFGWTCPGWAFSWGWSPAAVPWILENVYQSYQFTQDIDELRNTIFPMMVEEASFYQQTLKKVTYKNGVTRLATVPAYSPEQGPYTAGNTYENTLVWQLFHNCIEAAEALNKNHTGSVTEETIKQWKDIESQLKPIEIGDSNQIKEWYDETALGYDTTGPISGYEKHHRHLSHLLGLFPGNLINEDTPAYLDAAKTSLSVRGDDATGWGMGQRLNAWARIQDGDHAYKIIQEFFKNGANPNLWDSHPPFQVDGNFGFTSGVAEMLIQSNAGFIHLLPALPTEWKQGSVRGLKAQGNFEISESWNDGKMTTATITSNAGSICQVEYKGLKDARITDENGRPVTITAGKNQNFDRISFPTEKGKTYHINMSEKKIYTLDFDSNGGNNVDSQQIIVGDKAIKPSDPAKVGYVFVGWMLNGKMYDFNIPIENSFTLTANWKKQEIQTYTINFDSEGGSKTDSQQIIAGNKLIKPKDPIRKGYTFIGWIINERPYDFHIPITYAFTLHAKWEKSDGAIVAMQKNETPSNPNDTSVNTADHMHTNVVITILMLSGCILLFILKKRNLQ